MNKYFVWNKKEITRLQCAFFGTSFFHFIAYAFAYFNFYPQHDAINHSLGFAGAWEVSLGRFLLPIYGNIRGKTTMPVIIGLLSILFLSCTVYLITSILGIEKPILIVLTAGFLSVNLSITEICGAFIFVEDSYMLSLALACLGVYLLNRKADVLSVIMAGICFCLSMGIYQVYITVVATLFILMVCRDAIKKDNLVKNCFEKYVYYCFSLLLGAVSYILCYKFALRYWDVEPADSYNSLSRLATLSVEQILAAIDNNYKNFFLFFWGGGKGAVIGASVRWCNLFLFIIAILFLAKRICKQRLPLLNGLVIILGVTVYPGVALLMDIMMQRGTIGFYVSYALFLVYPVLLLIIFQNEGIVHKFYVVIRGLSLLCAVVLLSKNIIYSNAAYTKQKILYDRTIYNMTKIFGDLDSESDYTGGETAVVVIGRLGQNTNLNNITSEYSMLSGFERTSITYTLTMGSFAGLLGVPLTIENDSNIIEEYNEMEEVKEMPAYPKAGYCKMIDGRMVLKMS